MLPATSMHDPWVLRADKKNERIAVLLLGVCGAALAIAVRIQPDLTTHAELLFACGLGFVALAVIAWVVDFEATVTVDPARRQLVVVKKTRFSTHRTALLFSAIDHVAIVSRKKLSDDRGGPRCDLVVIGKDGKRTRTGRTTAFASELHEEADRLANAIGVPRRLDADDSPGNPSHLLVAAGGALGIYAGWYRVSVGPWCRAMWFGTAPLVIVVVSFGMLYSILRRFSRT